MSIDLNRFRRVPRRAALALATLVMTTAAAAQSFVVSTGPAGNTYDVMFQQFTAQCQGEVGVPFVGKTSAGSMENVDRLANNEVTASLSQSDVLAYRSKLEDMTQIRVLFALHPEELHVLVLSELRKEGGMAGLGGKPVVFDTFSDLRGRRIGAWGGSLITAQVLRLQSEVAFTLVEFADQPTALKALTDKSVDAVLSVGGSPQAWMQKLDRRYKLVAFNDKEATALKSVYRTARVTYPNLGQTGLVTVATDAVMITRQFRSAAMLGLLARVRDCFRSQLVELQDKPGNHPKWQAVSLDTVPRWAMLELPPSAVNAAAGKARIPIAERR